MADLAGDARRATVGPSVQNQTSSDPGRQPNVDHVLDSTSAAELQLAEGAQVGVVLDLDGEGEAFLHLLGRSDPMPAGEDPSPASPPPGPGN